MRPRLFPTAICTLAALAGGAFARHQAIDRSQAYLASTLEDLVEARERISFERPPLWGDAVEGDAWPHYMRALGIIGCQDDFFRRMRLYGKPTFAWDDPELRALAAAKRPALEALRLGAHSLNAEVQIQWELHIAARIPKSVHVRSLIDVALVELWNAAGTAGEPEALRSVLDAHQLALDLMNTPSVLVSQGGRSYLLPERLMHALEDGLAGRLSAESRALWVQTLDRLAESIEAGHPGEHLANEGSMEMVARVGLSPGMQLTWMPLTSKRDLKAGFPFAYNDAIAAADVIRDGIALLAEARSNGDLPSEERKQWIREQDCIGFRPSNPMASLARYDVRTRAEKDAFPLTRLSQAREYLAAP